MNPGSESLCTRTSWAQQSPGKLKLIACTMSVDSDFKIFYEFSARHLPHGPQKMMRPIIFHSTAKKVKDNFVA